MRQRNRNEIAAPTQRHRNLPLITAALSFAAFVLVAPRASFAQTCIAGHDMSQMGHDMGQMKEIPPPDKLPAPIKMTGIGNSHLTITANPEAQMWFTQGLNLLHDFWDYESARAFQQSVRVDPQCAMCYWGSIRSLIFRHSDDRLFLQALANAVRLKDHANKTRALYIDAAVASSEAEKAAGAEGKPDDTKRDCHLARSRQAISRRPAGKNLPLERRS